MPAIKRARCLKDEHSCLAVQREFLVREKKTLDLAARRPIIPLSSLEYRGQQGLEQPEPGERDHRKRKKKKNDRRETTSGFLNVYLSKGNKPRGGGGEGRYVTPDVTGGSKKVSFRGAKSGTGSRNVFVEFFGETQCL